MALVVIAAAPPQPSANEKAAIAKVKAELKDPDSAQFRGVKEYEKGVFCGWVNAKNSFGGYAGFGLFFIGRDGKVALLPPSLSSSDLCE